MSHVPILPPASASEQTKLVYEEFYRRMSFPAPPNFIMTQGHSHAVARGTWELVRNVLVGGDSALDEGVDLRRHLEGPRLPLLPRSPYRVLPDVRVGAESIGQVARDATKLSDPRLRQMILFALKCAREPQNLVSGDYDKLREQGLKQSEIVELVGMSALAVYANIIADATAMDADEMFDSI